MRLLLVLLTLLIALPASAHESRPAYLELIETRAGEWEVIWKQPVMGDQAIRLEPRLSNGWLARPYRDEVLTGSLYQRHWRILAPVSQLAGRTISIGGLEKSIVDVLVHVETAEGKVFDTILRRDNPQTTVDFGHWGAISAPAYFGLGVRHILAGIDHLLFVFGLILLVRAPWRVAGAVTGFTLGHSLTLAASALGFVAAPVATVEALVALSILFVARELLREGDSLTRRRPMHVASIFGLLHGFAFAGALAETGLPKDDIPLALLLFNLGVEAGQLLFVAAVALVLLAWRRFGGWDWPLPRLAPYAMGCYAAFLFMERTAAAFA